MLKYSELSKINILMICEVAKKCVTLQRKSEGAKSDFAVATAVVMCRNTARASQSGGLETDVEVVL